MTEPDSDRAGTEAFWAPFDSCFVITGRGTCIAVDASAMRGTVHSGDAIDVVINGSATRVACHGVEDIRALDERGRPRPLLGIRVGDIAPFQASSGDFVAAASTWQPWG